MLNRAVRVEVHVDGKPFGSIPMTGHVVVPVTPGSHHIELRTSQGKSTVGTLDAQGDKVINVTMSAMGSPRI
jgi:hypothetical protein